MQINAQLIAGYMLAVRIQDRIYQMDMDTKVYIATLQIMRDMRSAIVDEMNSTELILAMDINDRCDLTYDAYLDHEQVSA